MAIELELERIKGDLLNSVDAINKTIATLKAQRNGSAPFVSQRLKIRDRVQLIETEIRKQRSNFNIDNILIALKAQPGIVVSSALGREVSQVINKLRQRAPAEVEVVTPGIGRRSGTYKFVKC